jgi:hypothetical protein
LQLNKQLKTKMIFPEKYKLPFSKGSKWIEELVKAHSATLPSSSFLKITGKLYKEITALSKVIEKTGLPKHLEIAHVHPDIDTGIFLKAGSKPLEVGTLIGVYTGLYELVHDGATPNGSYSYEIAEDIRITHSDRKKITDPSDQKASLKKNSAYTVYTSALKMGNFTRFINHSSLEPNIEAVLSKLPSGRVEIILFTQRKIYPGEQLLSCYGGHYWKALKLIPNDITPSTYMISSKGNVLHKNPVAPMDETIKQHLFRLRNPLPSMPEELKNTLIVKKLKKLLSPLTKKRKEEVEDFEEIILEKGLPLNLTLDKKLGFECYSKERINKNKFIGVLAGSFSKAEKKNAILLTKTARTKLFLVPDREKNFLNTLPESIDGNVQITLVYDKESDQIYPLAFATKTIKEGEELKLLHPLPL